MQVAQKMVGPAYAAFDEAARIVGLYVDGTDYEVRNYFNGGPVTDNNLAKIKRGLEELEATEPAPVPMPKPDRGPQNLDDLLDNKFPAVKGSGKWSDLPATREEAASRAAAEAKQTTEA
jgi:hypothetical protein